MITYHAYSGEIIVEFPCGCVFKVHVSWDNSDGLEAHCYAEKVCSKEHSELDVCATDIFEYVCEQKGIEWHKALELYDRIYCRAPITKFAEE